MMMVVASFEVRYNGKVADTFVFRRGKYNHCDIFNNHGILFEGDICGANKEWNDLLARSAIFNQMPGYEIIVTK